MSVPAAGVVIRRLAEAEVPEATRICRLAFGTFFNHPEPHNLWPDRDFVGPRWRAAPEAVFAAEVDHRLAGSNLATRWGSFAFFGPLTIRPELWDRGIAQKLLGPTVDLFDSWEVTDAGLFTFAHSPKHLALYQKFGFWPRYLTALTSKPVAPNAAVPFKTFSSLDDSEQFGALALSRRITDRILDGLDVSGEISAVHSQALGDTILVDGEAFAVCHCGPGTEAGHGVCYLKFAAVKPGPGAEKTFNRLLEACECFAAQRGLERIEAGINVARRHAYRAMLRHGFRASTQGVAMHRPDQDGFNRADVFAIDDWR